MGVGVRVRGRINVRVSVLLLTEPAPVQVPRRRDGCGRRALWRLPVGRGVDQRLEEKRVPAEGVVRLVLLARLEHGAAELA